MKYYIGLGGLGCTTVFEYSKECRDAVNKEFFFIDTDRSWKDLIPEAYVIPNDIKYGSAGMRCIGRNSLIYDLYTGELMSQFDKIKKDDEVELIFVLSSCGGFGSSAVFPLLDYLEALSWGRLKACTVISFNESFLIGCPDQVRTVLEANTYEFVCEMNSRDQAYSMTNNYNSKIFNPGCTVFLINSQSISRENYWRYIDAPKEELKELDCKEQYIIKPTRTKKPVFISYSSKDQKTADLIVEKLKEAGISSWIATKDIRQGAYTKKIMQGIREANVFLVLISKNSIKSEHVKTEIDRAFNRLKDGIKIIPFILDDAELDDECLYYLCRQEMVSGNFPPLEERINDLICRIRENI